MNLGDKHLACHRGQQYSKEHKVQIMSLASVVARIGHIGL